MKVSRLWLYQRYPVQVIQMKDIRMLRDHSIRNLINPVNTHMFGVSDLDEIELVQVFQSSPAVQFRVQPCIVLFAF